jgi:O-antigen ligase
MNRIVSHKWPGGMNSLDMALLLAVVTMPFDYLWNSYSIVLFAAFALLSNSVNQKKELIRKRAFFCILPLSYFVWMMVTLIWDKGTASAECMADDLGGSASWFVFPVLFSTMDRINPQSIKKVLLAFVASNLVASFYCFWKAYQVYKSTNYINVFFYHHLSEHINISAIYFSLYCVFSIYILFFYFLFKRQSVWVRLLCLLTTGYLTFFVVVLSSKTMIFLLYGSALIFTVYSFYYFRSKWGALIFSVLLVVMPVLLVKFPYVNARVHETQIKEYTGSTDDQNGLAVRGVLWESSWDLIRSRPLLGWGRYGAPEYLQKKYVQLGFKEGAKENYNSHNQYLYTWLCYGFLGLCILLFYAGSLVTYFSRNRNFLGICLMVLFILANITECMLEVQKGIVFFFLFGNLFLFHSTTPIRAKAA